MAEDVNKDNEVVYNFDLLDDAMLEVPLQYDPAISKEERKQIDEG